ncbi:hypothetical protein U9M48_009188 [Paspalum notatum var. saurae]|uniref:Pentatricopeptide repeat-containing protein n=1 Tax=Paspalum notatum var. saurae TaxID=547442 RepID=A0AAQ3SQT4_PASNO
MSPPRCAVSLPPVPTNVSATSTGRGGKKAPPHPTASQVRRLCKQGRLDSARRLLLDALPRPPPALLRNAVLIAYAACPTPRSDHYTYSCVLTACAQTRRLRFGKSVHAHLLRRACAGVERGVGAGALREVDGGEDGSAYSGRPRKRGSTVCVNRMEKPSKGRVGWRARRRSGRRRRCWR